MGVIGHRADKFLAMGEAYGVCPTQSHHFLDSEPSGSEQVNDIRKRHCRSWEIAFHGRGFRDSIIFSSEEDAVVRAADHGDEIAGSECEDVRAGDSVWTGEFEGGLGTNYEVKCIPGEGEIDVGVALGGIEGGGREKDGAVAAVKEAVVEEQAEGTGGGGGAGDLLVCYRFSDDFFESWTGLGVVVIGQSRLRKKCEVREEEEENKQC